MEQKSVNERNSERECVKERQVEKSNRKFVREIERPFGNRGQGRRVDKRERERERERANKRERDTQRERERVRARERESEREREREREERKRE